MREALPDLAGQGFFDLLDRVYETGERHVASAVPVRFQPAPEADLHERHVDFVYEPIVGPDGTVSGVFAQGHDVTESHAAQERLRENEAEAQDVLEGMGEGFLLLDREFRIRRIVPVQRS